MAPVRSRPGSSLGATPRLAEEQDQAGEEEHGTDDGVGGPGMGLAEDGIRQVHVEQVGKIRDKTTGPALKAARYAVFAAFAISLGTVALVIFIIGAVRVLDVYLPNSVFGETHTWAAHSIIGAVLLLAGLVLFRSKARRRSEA